MRTRRIFGERLRAIRDARGLTQQELAEVLDRSVETISNIERGKSLPNFETILRLATALEVPPKELFDFDPTSSPKTETKLAELNDLARQLDDRGLNIAINLVRDLAKNSDV